MKQRLNNRLRAFRRSHAWATFLGVFWALVIVETARVVLPALL